MKYLVLALWASVGFAAPESATYKLDDPAIIGKYALQKPNKKSEVQSAQFYFDTDYKLSLYIDGIDKDLDLKDPSPEGVINRDEYEPIDCDHDETACGYVESTVAYLLQTKNPKGEVIPQLVLKVTESVYNEKQSKDGEPVYDDITTSYVLNWSEPLPHNGLPLFTYGKSQEMEDYLAHCQPLANSFIDYPSKQVFCPEVHAYDIKFGMEEGVQAAIGGWLKDKRTVKADMKRLKTTFFKLVEDNIATAVAHKASPTIAKQLKSELTRLEEFFADKAQNGAEFYFFGADYGDTAWIIDAKTKTILAFEYYKLNR